MHLMMSNQGRLTALIIVPSGTLSSGIITDCNSKVLFAIPVIEAFRRSLITNLSVMWTEMFLKVDPQLGHGFLSSEDEFSFNTCPQLLHVIIVSSELLILLSYICGA